MALLLWRGCSPAYVECSSFFVSSEIFSNTLAEFQVRGGRDVGEGRGEAHYPLSFKDEKTGFLNYHKKEF